MLYSVHGWYGKRNSRKQQPKIEAIVFAEDSYLARKLIESLFDGYPAKLDSFTTAGDNEQSLEEIYQTNPELRFEDPKRGFIYNEIYHRNCIERYFRTQQHDNGFVLLYIQVILLDVRSENENVLYVNNTNKLKASEFQCIKKGER